ncbi:MAG: Crp/Fnr family transcriptional regulator, partial [Agriterribacter sp.]
MLQHIGKYISISKEELDAIAGFLKPMQLKKKQNLLAEGNICHHNYFVAKGCLRMFFINEKGVEQTTEFALENWWLSDYASFEKQQPSGFYIQAVEKSDVVALHFQEQEKMLREYPQMERYFRLLH